MNIKKTKALNERNDIDEKIFNNEKWISGRVRDLEDVCGGEKSIKKKINKYDKKMKQVGGGKNVLEMELAWVAC